MAELSRKQIRKDRIKFRRRENRAEFREDVKTNKLLRKRYGVDIGKFATDDTREKRIQLANNKLFIKPEGLDPTRKKTKKTKAIAGAFQAIDQLIGKSEGEIDNTAARGEAFRIQELAELTGNKELEEMATSYLKTFKKNRKIGTGQGFADAVGHLRDIQQLINDAVNVDFLSSNYNLDKFDDPALYGGLTVGTKTNELVFGKTYQQAVKDREAANQMANDWNDSYGGDYGNWSPTTTQTTGAIREGDYAASSKDLPWWAK